MQQQMSSPVQLRMDSTQLRISGEELIFHTWESNDVLASWLWMMSMYWLRGWMAVLPQFSFRAWMMIYVSKCWQLLLRFHFLWLRCRLLQRLWSWLTLSISPRYGLNYCLQVDFNCTMIKWCSSMMFVGQIPCGLIGIWNLAVSKSRSCACSVVLSWTFRRAPLQLVLRLWRLKWSMHGLCSVPAAESGCVAFGGRSPSICTVVWWLPFRGWGRSMWPVPGSLDGYFYFWSQ